MIVDDFDLDWLVIDPGEAHPVLIVDPNAVLAIPITGQSLQTVAWWNPEIFETLSGVELVELASRHGPESLRATAASVFRVPAIEDVIGARVFKRADHDDTIARLSCYVKALPSTGWLKTRGGPFRQPGSRYKREEAASSPVEAAKNSVKALPAG